MAAKQEMILLCSSSSVQIDRLPPLLLFKLAPQQHESIPMLLQPVRGLVVYVVAVTACAAQLWPADKLTCNHSGSLVFVTQDAGSMSHVFLTTCCSPRLPFSAAYLPTPQKTICTKAERGAMKA
eukprot:1157153-Pelagomonas_calceolata.AAC.8